MSAPAQYVDPFAGGDSNPSVSWKDAPVGTVVTLEITDYPSMVQGRDFKTKEPATWPDGNPKMVVAINGKLDGGEVHTLWASKPSALFGAIKDAQKASGKSIAPGDTLQVKFTGTKPTAGDPQKLFAAKHIPGTPPRTSADPFGDAGSSNTGAALPGANTENADKWADASPPW